jgi:hypothetical protein
MRKLLTMLGIALIKPTHTHELRLNGWYGLEKGHKKSILVKGTHDECYERLRELAKEQNCGVGLLLNNGGYRVVKLAEEVIRYKKEAGVELYAALEDLSNYPLPVEVQNKIKSALRKAKVTPFLS